MNFVHFEDFLRKSPGLRDLLDQGIFLSEFSKRLGLSVFEIWAQLFEGELNITQG